MIIQNGKDTPISVRQGTIPDVSGALLDYFQALVFGVVTKTVQNFQVVETQAQVSFQGVIQPFTDRMLLLKPEGQRAWTWLWCHAEPSLVLEVDSVVTYLGVQYRVMSKKDYSLYGYVDYHLVQDYTGSGPEVSP